MLSYEYHSMKYQFNKHFYRKLHPYESVRSHLRSGIKFSLTELVVDGLGAGPRIPGSIPSSSEILSLATASPC